MANKFHSRYDKANAQHIEKEHISNYDYVDRSGYISLDLQYARLMRNGKTLEDIRDFEYNTDLKKLQDFVENKASFDDIYNKTSLYQHDKLQLDALFKEKLNKYASYVDSQKEYERLMREYQNLEEQKRIKQDAINEYKLSLEAKKQSDYIEKTKKE